MSKGEERTTDHAPQLENISIDRICSLIKQPTIRVVSFNILDTLLLRPVFDPNDIFHLIAKRSIKSTLSTFAQYEKAHKKN